MSAKPESDELLEKELQALKEELKAVRSTRAELAPVVAQHRMEDDGLQQQEGVLSAKIQKMEAEQGKAVADVEEAAPVAPVTVSSSMHQIFFTTIALAAVIIISVFLAVFGGSALGGAAEWSKAESQLCRAFAMTCEDVSYNKNTGYTYYTYTHFTLPEKPGTPVLSQLGSSSEVALQFGDGSMVSQGTGIVVSNNTTQSQHTHWTLHVVDTTSWQFYIPEMGTRALRIEIHSYNKQLLRASPDGSSVSFASAGTRRNRTTEWLLSMPGGVCCYVSAAGGNASRRFLSPAQESGAVELWSAEDAGVWNLQGIDKEWLRFLSAPATVGSFRAGVQVERKCAEHGTNCWGSVPSMGMTMAEIGITSGQLFGRKHLCYYDKALPTFGSGSAKVIPEFYKGLRAFSKDDLKNLVTFYPGFMAASLGSALVTLAIFVIVHFTCLTNAVVIRGYLCAFYFFFVCSVGFSVPVFHLLDTGPISGNDGLFMGRELSTHWRSLASKPTWLEVWDAAARDGHVGNSEEISSGATRISGTFSLCACLMCVVLHAFKYPHNLLTLQTINTLRVFGGWAFYLCCLFPESFLRAFYWNNTHVIGGN